MVQATVSWFQSTPPHGRRQEIDPRQLAQVLFQSTPPHGRRPGADDQLGCLVVFQSTPPHGRRLALAGFAPHQVKESLSFQSTPPHGRRRLPGVSFPYPSSSICRFNPRLRMGGDAATGSSTTGRSGQVSIHASAWEATIEAYASPTFGTLLELVSIHASAWEATGRKVARGPRTLGCCFNPRLRMGGDRPAGTTSAPAICDSFNPRLRMGGDRPQVSATLAYYSRSISFNPRLRMGGDNSPIVVHYTAACSTVSIHASAWEATRSGQHHSRSRWSTVSIHASAWEATSGSPRARLSLELAVSIHASAWEATGGAPGTRTGEYPIRSFNPRLRMGGDNSSV